MKKKSNLSEKIKAYSALAGSVVALAPAANAQVVYTDINPDSVFTNPGSFDIDINNDAVNDFQFNFSKQLSTGTYSFSNTSSYGMIYYSSVINGLVVTPLGTTGNQVLGDSSYNPTALSFNAPITASQSYWRSFSSQLMASYYKLNISGTYNGSSISYSSSSASGNFLNTSNKYLGVRIVVNTDTLYGWIRLDVSGGVNSYTVKDYAYQSSPGVGINAGEYNVGVKENNKALENFKVYSFNKSIIIENNSMIVKNKGVLTNTTYKVIELSGKEIMNGNLTQAREEIQANNLINGVYIVQVLNREGAKSFKVYLR